MIQIKRFVLALAACGMLAAQQHGWHYQKDDPHTKRHLLKIDAASFEATKDRNVFILRGMAARIFGANGETSREVKSDKAIVNLTTHTLTYGPGLSAEIKISANPR